MSKPVLAAGLALGTILVSAFSVSAQSTTQAPSRPTSSCSSGLAGGGPSCAPERRLLIDLRRRGAGAPMELEEVIGLGANAAGIFRLVAAQATKADSAIYAVIDVDRDTAGAYRIDESIAGSRSTTSGGCGGFSTGKLSDLGFGAYLAMKTTRIVRCAETDRARIKKQ